MCVIFKTIWSRILKFYIRKLQLKIFQVHFSDLDYLYQFSFYITFDKKHTRVLQTLLEQACLHLHHQLLCNNATPYGAQNPRWWQIFKVLGHICSGICWCFWKFNYLMSKEWIIASSYFICIALYYLERFVEANR